MTLTGHTITDDQIRALRDSCGPSSPYRIHCGIALGETHGALWGATRDSARARCAEILNAHAACSHERIEWLPLTYGPHQRGCSICLSCGAEFNGNLRRGMPAAGSLGHGNVPPMPKATSSYVGGLFIGRRKVFIEDATKNRVHSMGEAAARGFAPVAHRYTASSLLQRIPVIRAEQRQPIPVLPDASRPEEHPPGVDPNHMAHYLASRTLLTDAECAELDRSQPETIRALIAACATCSIPDAAQMLRSVLTRPDPPQAPTNEPRAHDTARDDRTK